MMLQKCDMKKWIPFLSGCTIIFTACNKQDLEIKTENDQTKIHASAAETTFYVSDWEQVSQWRSMDSANFRVFYSERSMPQLTSDVIANGVVVTYSKVAT